VPARFVDPAWTAENVTIRHYVRNRTFIRCSA
jgi:hypothetical protein